MTKSILVGTLLVALTGAVAWQGMAIRELRKERAGAPASEEAEDSSASVAENTPAQRAAAPSRLTVRRELVADEGLNARVAALEDEVAELNKASDFLMNRGQIPLTPERIAELQQKFMDSNVPARDRIQALNLLQRNNGLNESVLQAALTWIGSTTNGWVRDSLVRELGGTTNSIVRDPMMKLASADSDPRVRENAVRSLRRFATDPQVEALLWQMMRGEQNERVHEQVSDLLGSMPVTPERLADLRNRAIAEGSTLDERLLAVRALHRGGETAGEVSAALAQYAQNTQNPEERARVFSAFDGYSDSQMLLPLVSGLQDPNPTVRARAADALSGYRAEPNVAEWLSYVSQNDTDPRVRREAEQSLRELRAPQREQGGGGQRFGGGQNPQGQQGQRGRRGN